MKVRSLVSAACLCLTVGLLAACETREETGLTEGERARTSAAAERAVHELFAAMNAGDPDRALARYAPGDALVQVACTEIRRGHDSVGRIIRRWLGDDPDPAIQHEITRTEVLAPNAAVVAARARRQDGTGLYWTFVVRHDPDGLWRIVQEHQSWADCREPRVHHMGQ